MHTSQDWDSKGNLKAIKDLEHILFGEVAASWGDTNRANCDHLISALNVAYDANRTSFATEDPSCQVRTWIRIGFTKA